MPSLSPHWLQTQRPSASHLHHTGFFIRRYSFPWETQINWAGRWSRMDNSKIVTIAHILTWKNANIWPVRDLPFAGVFSNSIISRICTCVRQITLKGSKMWMGKNFAPYATFSFQHYWSYFNSNRGPSLLGNQSVAYSTKPCLILEQRNM